MLKYLIALAASFLVSSLDAQSSMDYCDCELQYECDNVINKLECLKTTVFTNFPTVTNNRNYTQVIEVSPLGGGQDDAPNIRTKIAQLQFGEMLLFKNGSYNIETVETSKEYFFLLDNSHSGTALKFEDNAYFNLNNIDASTLLTPTTFIKIDNDSGAATNCVENIVIDGLNLNGNMAPVGVSNRIHGITIQERETVDMLNINILNSVIINMTGAGIINWGGKEVTIKNIITKDNGTANSALGQVGQGIGTRFTYTSANFTGASLSSTNNIQSVIIDNHISIRDFQSVDWSGSEVYVDLGLCSGSTQTSFIDNYMSLKGKSRASNLCSVGSRAGSKIAGFWDVEIDDFKLICPTGNGFWMNGDYPSSYLKLSNASIENTVFNSISLGVGNFELNNIKIDNDSNYTGSSDFLCHSSNLLINGLDIDSEKGTCLAVVNCHTDIQNLDIVTTTTSIAGKYYGGQHKLTNASIVANSAFTEIYTHFGSQLYITDDLANVNNIVVDQGSNHVFYLDDITSPYPSTPFGKHFVGEREMNIVPVDFCNMNNTTYSTSNIYLLYNFPSNTDIYNFLNNFSSQAGGFILSLENGETGDYFNSFDALPFPIISVDSRNSGLFRYYLANNRPLKAKITLEPTRLYFSNITGPSLDLSSNNLRDSNNCLDTDSSINYAAADVSTCSTTFTPLTTAPANIYDLAEYTYCQKEDEDDDDDDDNNVDDCTDSDSPCFNINVTRNRN